MFTSLRDGRLWAVEDSGGAARPEPEEEPEEEPEKEPEEEPGKGA